MSKPGGLGPHDRVGLLRAARCCRASVVGPGNLQVVAPPVLSLASHRQGDVDGCQVGKCHRRGRVENLVAEAAVRSAGAASDLDGPAGLDGFFNAIPLQALDVEHTRLIGGETSKTEPEEIEAKARILAQLSEANLSSRRLR